MMDFPILTATSLPSKNTTIPVATSVPPSKIVASRHGGFSGKVPTGILKHILSGQAQILATFLRFSAIDAPIAQWLY